MTTEAPKDAQPPAQLVPGALASWSRQASPVLPPPLAIAEIALLLAVVLLEYFWDGFPALTRINPHPYWIAILLLSLQYGTVSGLMAASIAIIGTVLIGMPEPDIEERYFNYLIRVWTQPVLWLLVAMLLGTFRARQIEQRADLVRQAENLRVRGATLLDYANNLRARVTTLERRLATRESSETGRLLAALARLDEASPGRWAAALATAFDTGFPGGRFTLYSIEGETARLLLHHPDDAVGTLGAQVAEIEAGHPLLERVARDRRPATVLDQGDDVMLAGMGVAAVPVFGDGGRVIGLLKADGLPPGQIDGALTRRLAVIAVHLAPALQLGSVAAVVEPDTAGGAVTAAERTGGEPVRTLEHAIPTVRRWRLLKWLPGGRAAPSTPPDGQND